jgi:hypothetical protein
MDGTQLAGAQHCAGRGAASTLPGSPGGLDYEPGGA